jgi:hypothetical protein
MDSKKLSTEQRTRLEARTLELPVSRNLPLDYLDSCRSDINTFDNFRLSTVHLELHTSESPGHPYKFAGVTTVIDTS